MSGVEAAASLFGSEDSDSDPFTAMGTDNASINPFDELLTDANEPSSGTSIFDEPAFSTNDTVYSQYYAQSPQNGGDGHDFYNHSQRHAVGESSWGRASESHTTNSSKIRPFLFPSNDPPITQPPTHRHRRPKTTRTHTHLMNTPLEQQIRSNYL